MSNEVNKGEDFGLVIKSDGVSMSGKDLGDHISDLISPFCGSLGFLGDKVRDVRQKSAIRALTEAHELAKKSGISIEPIPHKNLIKIVECASAEEPDSELIGFWSRILVNSIGADEALNNLFIDILKRMSTNQAKMLLKIASSNKIHDAKISNYKHRNERLNQILVTQVDDKIQEFLVDNDVIDFENMEDLEKANLFAFEYLISEYKWSQTVLISIGFNHRKTHEKLEYKDSFFNDNNYVSQELLSFEGLVREREVNSIKKDEWSLEAKLLELTSIGGMFAEAISDPEKIVEENKRKKNTNSS